MTITFDGVRLSYVGDMGAFSFCIHHSEDEKLVRALHGCATLAAAEEALFEIAMQLSLWITDVTESESCCG